MCMQEGVGGVSLYIQKVAKYWYFVVGGGGIFSINYIFTDGVHPMGQYISEVTTLHEITSVLVKMDCHHQCLSRCVKRVRRRE